MPYVFIDEPKIDKPETTGRFRFVDTEPPVIPPSQTYPLPLSGTAIPTLQPVGRQPEPSLSTTTLISEVSPLQSPHTIPLPAFPEQPPKSLQKQPSLTSIEETRKNGFTPTFTISTQPSPTPKEIMLRDLSVEPPPRTKLPLGVQETQLPEPTIEEFYQALQIPFELAKELGDVAQEPVARKTEEQLKKWLPMIDEEIARTFGAVAGGLVGTGIEAVPYLIPVPIVDKMVAKVMGVIITKLPPSVVQVFKTPLEKLIRGKIISYQEAFLGKTIDKTLPAIVPSIEEKGLIIPKKIEKIRPTPIQEARPIPIEPLKVGGIQPKIMPKIQPEAKVTPVPATTVEPIQKIPKELEPLAVEARKYKSAEEFIDKEATYFHGTKSGRPIEIFEKRPDKNALTISFTKNRKFAEKFGDVQGFKVNPKNTFDFKNEQHLNKLREQMSIEGFGDDFSLLEKRIRKGDFEAIEQARVETNIQKAGFDSYLTKETFKGETAINLQVFSQDIIKTKSQLTYIFNQATRKTQPLPSKPLPIVKPEPVISSEDYQSFYAKKASQYAQKPSKYSKQDFINTAKSTTFRIKDKVYTPEKAQETLGDLGKFYDGVITPEVQTQRLAKEKARLMRAEEQELFQESKFVTKKVIERGGIRPYAKNALGKIPQYEEYVSNVPIAIRRKGGLPPDEMASELGFESDTELYKALQQEKGDFRLYDTGGYAKSPPPKPRPVIPERLQLFEMPEIVELAKELLKGKYPTVVTKIRAMKGLARGVFKPIGSGKIALKADIFKDPQQAAKILSHEIGHLADWLPEGTLARGNILGRIASLKNYTKRLLEEYPGSAGVLTLKDRARIRREAEKIVKAQTSKNVEVQQAIVGEFPLTSKEILSVWNDIAISEKNPKLVEYIAKLSNEEKKSIVKEALKGRVSNWVTFKNTIIKGYETIIKAVHPDKSKDAIRQKYFDMIKREILKRALYERWKIMDELKALTHLWKPFDKYANPSFTKYRYSPEELYADAFSVLLNNPKLLQRKAPTFHKAFFSYIERKPEVKQNYDLIQSYKGEEAIGKHRDTLMEEMFEKGEKKQIEKKEPIHILDILNKELIEKNERLFQLIERKRKSGVVTPDEDNPKFWVEQLPYLSSEYYQHIRDINNTILIIAKKEGILATDIGKLAMLNRIISERKSIANPLGYSSKEATDQIIYLKRTWGEDKYNRVVKHLEAFYRLRDTNIIPVLEKSRQFDPKLMEYIKNNKIYVTFDVQKYIEERYGQAITGHIYKQEGTLEEITNPFVATLMKDAALIRTANVTQIKQKTLEWLQKNTPEQIQDAKYKFNGKARIPIEPHDPKLGMVAYLRDGKIIAKYIPKDIADVFQRSSYETGTLLKLLETPTNFLKEILVSKNPAWSLWNIPRDARSWIKQLPGANPINLIQYYIKASPDTWQDILKNVSTKDVADMYKKHMISHLRIYGTEEPSEMLRLDKMLLYLGMNKKQYNNVVLRPFIALWNALDISGRFWERLPKVAGYKYLKAKYPEMSEERLRNLVISRAGSPDFWAGGVRRRTMNVMYLFSNAGIRGVIAAFEAAKENPASYALKTIGYDLLPKILMYMAQIGAIGIGVKHIMDRIPNRDKQNYIIIPLGLTQSDKAVYFVIPHDFQGQIAAGLFWNALQTRKLEDTKVIFDYMQGQLPYSGLNPILGVGADLLQYLSGKNPYDEWTGRSIIPPQVFEAGGMRSHKTFLKYAWNSLGGSTVYKFKNEDLQTIKGSLEKIYGIPLAEPFLRRFLRVSDWGMEEELRKVAKEVGQKRAGELLTEREEAIEQFKRTGMVKGSKYQKKFLHRKLGSAYDRVISSVSSKKEKEAVRKKYLELGGGKPE